MPPDPAPTPFDLSAGSGAESALPEFRLQFTSAGGEHHPGGLYEWMSVLNVRGGMPPWASMMVTRHNGDLIGRPVGLFSGPLPSARVRRLVELLDAVDPGSLPKPTAGDVNANNLQLSYRRGKRELACACNVRDQAYLAVIGPVVAELAPMMSELLVKPERAITVSVEKSEDGGPGTRLRMLLTNVGTGDVLVADPRLVSPGSPEPRAFMQVAPRPARVPGEMVIPPRWQRVGLEPAPPEVADEGRTIRSKDSLTILSATWNAPAPGDYVAQAVWQDYVGPTKLDLTKVQAAVPKDAEGSDKVFVVRGAAFSSYVRFTVSAK